jgi:hypothetical protein
MPVHSELEVEAFNKNTPCDESGEDVGFTVDRTAGEASQDERIAVIERLRRMSGAASNNSELLADAKRYRKRAQNAEQELNTLKTALAERETKLAEHESRLQEREQTIAAMQRTAALDQALIEADAVDLETARLLAEHACKSGARSEESPGDPQAIVDDLRRRKPFLFRHRSHLATTTSGAMSVKSGEADSPAAVAKTIAAADALETGKRTDLLRYLRLRRRAS